MECILSVGQVRRFAKPEGFTAPVLTSIRTRGQPVRALTCHEVRPGRHVHPYKRSDSQGSDMPWSLPSLTGPVVTDICTRGQLVRALTCHEVCLPWQARSSRPCRVQHNGCTSFMCVWTQCSQQWCFFVVFVFQISFKGIGILKANTSQCAYWVWIQNKVTNKNLPSNLFSF